MDNLRKIIIIIITTGVFLFSYSVKYNSIKEDFVETANSTHLQLNQYVKLSSDFIDLMGVYGNEFLKHDYDYNNEYLKYLKYDSEKKHFNLDSINDTKYKDELGNLTGLGQIPSSQSDKKELLMVSNYNPFFKDFYSKLPGIAWIYYTSKNKYMNLYPWVSSEEFLFTEEVMEKEFYAGGLPQANPSRSRFWSSVYLDLAGKGIMVTVSTPIYENDDFKGVVSLDFTTNQLNSLLKQKYNAFVLNDIDQIVASTIKSELLEKQIVTLNDLLDGCDAEKIKNPKNSQDKTLKKYDGNYIYSASFKDAPWKLYFLLPQYIPILQSFLFCLPVLIIGVLLVLSIYESEVRKKAEHELKDSVKELKSYQEMLEKAATIDFLTKTLNRRGMAGRLGEEVSRYNESQSTFSIIMGDVDNFKKVNDIYGHAAGDKILVEIAEAMKNNVRTTDLVCRWGGEEFLILLRGTAYKDALVIAEKLRIEIEKTNINWEDELNLNVTITMGVNEYSSQSGIERCISEVDRALYVGKEMGRNRVIGYRDIVPEI